MKLYSLAVGVAATVLLAAVDIRSEQQPQTQPPTPPVATAAATRPAPGAPSAPAATKPPTAAQFDAVVKPLFNGTCIECHNETDAEAGFVVTRYDSVESLTEDRDHWDTILSKLKSGEMPPLEVEYPKQQVEAMIAFLEAEFKRAAANVNPDPGRVPARRLNRAEYTNTIRDRPAIDFRADKNFPTDDSGDGFDNIGDILTVSPVLMEKYMSAAERIAARTVAAEALPKPIEIEYSLRLRNLRRINPSNVEATHRVDFDAQYQLVVGLPGERPADAKPVTLGLWVDGKLLTTKLIET